jgi:hypothetical protein
VREYYREPAAVARLVTDVLLTGNYEATAGGIKVDLTKCPDNLIPDPFSKQFTVEKEVKVEKIYVWDVPYLDARSFASQLFEVTAINLALQPRGFRYEQPTPKEYATSKNEATGKTVDIKIQETKAFGSGEGRIFTGADIATAAYKISGKDERHFVLTAAQLSTAESANQSLREAYDLANRDQRVIALFSPMDLHVALKNTLALDQWPPIVRLDASKKPVGLKDGGAHFLVISSRSDDGHQLSVDNTWAESKDLNGRPTISTSEIAESIFSARIAAPSTVADHRNLANIILTAPKLWTAKVNEWIRIPDKLNSEGKQISPAEYERTHPDSELKKWILEHPEDVKLQLWKKLLVEWHTKYPH